MEKIESFKVNHSKLVPGLYVSRKDEKNGVCTTTFDIRFTYTNNEPALDGAASHTIEHLAATYLRNSCDSENIIYFGPMGCRTGFYLVMFGDLQSKDVYNLVYDTFSFIANFNDIVPGTAKEECGNYIYHDLPMAKFYAKKYLTELEKKIFTYPE